jgi:uncharacterized protein (DUF1499 family)
VHAVEPIPFEGDAQAAHRRLVDLLEATPRCRVVAREPLVVKAEFRSRIFRFVDDVVLVLDPDARVIHCRSSSRLGYSDLGANRRRVEWLRRALQP